MKTIFVLLVIYFSVNASAKEIARYEDWRERSEKFVDGETNFKLVMQKLLERYVDKQVTKEDLYRAATSGMLEALNSEATAEAHNQLLSPTEIREVESDLASKITGIGVEMKFDEQVGQGHVFRIIPGSPAERAGMQKGDIILSVNGKHFKGKKFGELVSAVRGEIGKSVGLRILRGDEIVKLKITRDIVKWEPVQYEKIDETTAILTIAFFNSQTAALVEKAIEQINTSKIDRLIVDLRDNAGGDFEQALKVGELFVPKGATIVSTIDRNGKNEKFVSNRGLLRNDLPLYILVDKRTVCGAELLTAALQENRKAKLIGETTYGKWDAQTLEKLPNNFAVKFTVKEFRSPQGKSYAQKGLQPDVVVAGPATVTAESREANLRELRAKFKIPERLTADPQLKTAVELAKMR